jgi:C4-dicarboxylate-specific signal transduction histidine kinase
VTSAAAPVTADTPNGTLAAYAVLEDLQNRPTILLRTETDRSILDSARATLHYALLSAIAIGLAMLLVLQRLLGRAVITPLAQLTETALRIGASDDDTARIDLERDDEIGVLASEFDSMLRKLATSRQALVSAARTAGMSEIATGILHNIGNVLNSVVLSRQLVAETLDRSQLGQLRRVLELLEEQDDLAHFLTADPRGQKLLPFLEALTRTLEEERERARDELAGLGEGVEHIRELVASQQALAGRSTVVERISVAEQVERAIEVTASANGSDAKLVVEREVPELPAQLLDRHKLLEILVNLVQNARQSVSEAEVDDPHIAVRVAAEGGRLTIRVADNGRGIAPEHLEQIFAHGFTTRRNGHGFGLHASANSARELGGELSVRSDGPGRGAEFTLSLPFDDGSRDAWAA